jgi:hypothetical protein
MLCPGKKGAQFWILNYNFIRIYGRMSRDQGLVNGSSSGIDPTISIIC